MAGAAGILNDLARAVTLGAVLLHREKALLHTHLAHAVAGGAGLGLGAGLGAAAVAHLARIVGRDTNLGLGAVRGFFERYFEVVAQVCATIDAIAPAATGTSLAEDVSEDVAEGIGKTTEARLARAAATATGGIQSGMTMTVVDGTLLFVGENLVGLFGFLEFLFRALVVRIAVGVMLHGQLAIGLFQRVLVRITRHTQHFVVVPLRHCRRLTQCSQN